MHTIKMKASTNHVVYERIPEKKTVSTSNYIQGVTDLKYQWYSNCILMYTFSNESKEFTLPKPKYTVICTVLHIHTRTPSPTHTQKTKEEEKKNIRY